MDDCILEEATHLSKPYSILRSTGQKWKTSSTPHQHPTPPSIQTDSTNNLIQISKAQTLDVYKSNHLYKRSVLRKSPSLLKVFQYIWECINPYKFSGISKKVYVSFFEVAYKQTKRDTLELLDQNIQKDKKADFGHKSWLGFSELYDSVFEFLDSYTKSFASIEYVFLLKSVLSALQDSKWCSSINLYSKLHLPPEAKPVYHTWMVPLLRSPKLNKDEVPDMIKVPSEVHVSERLLKKKLPKPVDRENFNVRKLELMMSAHLLKGFKQTIPRCSTQQTFRPKRVTPVYFNRLDKISPLSIVLKQSKSRADILEKVIDGRKTLNFLGKYL